MLVNVNALGYKGLAKVIEEDTSGYELELQESNMKGKRIYISKNSTSETVEVIKFSSKVEYEVSRDSEDYNPETGKYESPINGRDFSLTITTTSEDIAYILWENCFNYLQANASFEIIWSGCPSVEEAKNNKVSYYDTISVCDKEEYNELKDLYKEWKNKLRV